MHDFRRRPADLTPEQKQALEALFGRVPVLGQIYHMRWQATAIITSVEISSGSPRSL